MAIHVHRKPGERSRPVAMLAVRSLRRHRAWLFQAYMLLLALTFAVLAFFVSTTPYFGFDLAFTRALQAYSPPWFDVLMRAVSQLGFDWKAIVAIGLVTLYLFFIGLRWEAVVGVVGSTGIWLLDNIVKMVINRPRPSPDLVHVITPLNGPSFTSGHVTSFVAFYGFQWFLAYTLLKPSWKRTLLLAFLGILILLVGLSRIYSGEHWPSDVFGSYLLGTLWLALIIQLYRWGRSQMPVRRLLHEERTNMKIHSPTNRFENTALDRQRAANKQSNLLTMAIDGYLIVAALGIVALGWLVHDKPYLTVDLMVTRAIQSFNPPWFDWIMRSINWLGFGVEATSLVVLIILVTFLAGWRWEAAVAAVDAATIWAVNIVISYVVNRPYPAPGPDLNGMLVDLTRPSFPGGHASSFIAFYGFVFYLVYTRVTRQWLRIPLLLAFAALPILVIPSRMYMGRHWPTDTLAAVLLGTIWLLLSIRLYQWGKAKAWVREHLADSRPVWQH